MRTGIKKIKKRSRAMISSFSPKRPVYAVALSWSCS